jgi:hypothetical protein
MLFDPKWEQRVAIEPWRQELLDAADYIETHGWCRGMARMGSAVCAIEALVQVASNLDEPHAWMRLAEHLQVGSVADWNDRPGQTKANVVATMRAAARQE